MENFAEDVKRLRDYLGISQELLASIIGVSRQCLQQWEYGNRPAARRNIDALKQVDECSVFLKACINELIEENNRLREANEKLRNDMANILEVAIEKPEMLLELK